MGRRRLAQSLAAVAVALGACTAWAQPEPTEPAGAQPADPVALHDEARALYARGDYRGAVARLEEAVRLDPGARELHYNLGLVYEILGDRVRALANYEKSLEGETAPAERETLERTIDRVRRAEQVAEHTKVAVPPPPPQRPPDPVPAAGCARCVWAVLPAAVGGSFLVTGMGLGTAAVARDPGRDAHTSARVSIDDLRRDASRAHGLAIGADVCLALGALGLAATAISLPLLASAPDADEAGARVQTRFAVGPARASLEVSW